MIALAAPDKYRGSATASTVARAIGVGARRAGWECRERPLADGGEGTLDALGGPNQQTVVTGPLGAPVRAGWRLADGRAVIEAARASGLALVGGMSGNDPLRASTRGTGEIIAAALDSGAESVIVGVGGSATTDGGLGAIEVLRGKAPFRVPVSIACDVQICFGEAAALFGPQKGASAEQVVALAARLESLAAQYREEFGVDVTSLPGSGAAGGLAGGLAALGAVLVPGFDLVARAVGLEEALDGVDAIVTGEGRLDATSLAGKVVGELVKRGATQEVDVVIVVGEVDRSVSNLPLAISLTERFGSTRAWTRTGECVALAVEEALAGAYRN